MIAKSNNPARGIVPTVDPAGPATGGFRALTSFRVHLLAGLSLRNAELRFQRRFGLRLLECRIIGVIGPEGVLSLKRICGETDIEKAHASRLVQRLIDRRLVEKVGDAADLRAISVRLTPAGTATYHAIFADAVDRNRRWAAALTDDECRILGAAIEKLIEATRLMMAQEQE